MNYAKKIEALEKRLERLQNKLNKVMCLCRKQANEIEALKRFDEAADWAIMRHERRLYPVNMECGRKSGTVDQSVEQSVGQSVGNNDRGTDGGTEDEQAVTQVMNEYLLFPDELDKLKEVKP